jgi:hypothetical protein
MFNKFGRLFVLIAVLVPILQLANLALAAETRPGATGQSPTFTVSVPSAFARGVPNLASPWTQSVFAGQTFGLRARTADGRWLELASPGVQTNVWVLATWGTVSGALDRVPVFGGTKPSAMPVVEPTPLAASIAAGKAAAAVGAAPSQASVASAVAAALANDAVLPQVSERAREIYRTGLALGNNPQTFSKVGDCL